jgi:hypothetical protein
VITTPKIAFALPTFVGIVGVFSAWSGNNHPPAQTVVTFSKLDPSASA